MGMVKKYIESIDELSWTAKRIVRRYPWGFQGAVAEGGRGIGKTAFCLHTAREVYQYIEGIDRIDAWKRVLGVGPKTYREAGSKVLFTIKDVVNALEILDSIDMDNVLEWQKENTVPCFCWDDAGMHGGKYKFFIAVKMVDYLKGLMDTMRFVTSGFLINAPELSGLLGFIREYKDQLVINIAYDSDGGTTRRQANIQQYSKYKSGKRLKVVSVTKFNSHVDSWAYEIYNRMKAKAIIENKNALKQVTQIAKKENPKKTSDEIMDEMGVPEQFKSMIEP